MMSHASNDPHLWAIVLAGGEGERMKPLVERWLGGHRPKQYCAFVGSRSMFQHTVDRALAVTRPEQIIAVVGRDHCEHVTAQLLHRGPARVIYQPANRDTAAGIFLPLTYVAVQDPEATIVVLPSDHFAYPEERFVQAIREAVLAARAAPGRVVLLGVPPDRLELDYGWIERERSALLLNGIQVNPVRSFLEKPDKAKAQAAWRAGALWNTLVFAARIETLWNLGRRCLPSLMSLFDRLREAIGTPEEDQVLQAIYQIMPAKNISFDLLQCATEHLTVLELNEVLWSDWGRPERVGEALRKIGRVPAFPEELLASGGHLPAQRESNDQTLTV